MSIFSIGVSGLNAAQVALNTTSNNIANIYTPGYNRELTLLQQSLPGGGTEVVDIQRQFNAFTASQLNDSAGQLSALEAYETQVNQVDNLLADRDAGLAPLLQDFFSALSDLTSAPSDPASRQGVLGTADTLAAQVRSMGNYLQDMRDGVNTRIEAEVSQINNSAALIAQLNKDIAIARARTGSEPNSLLNQRDQLIAELSERVDVQVYVQDGGSYNLSIGNGQPLVSGGESYSLTATPSALDPGRLVVAYQDAAGNSRPLSEDTFGAGALGGLMAFRSETLDPVQNRLGQLAVSLAVEFNAQHAAGLDLNGDPGGDFFSIATPVTTSSLANTGTASLSAVVDDVSGLEGLDYDLRVADAAAGDFLVTPSDGSAPYTVTLDASNQLSIGGTLVTVDNPALLVDGDRFQLRPTRDAAQSLETVFDDVALIAAGQVGGSGDNLNALALQDLQGAALVGGNASLSQAYAALVSDVGNRTNIVQINRASQEGVTAQIRALQQSESGVNLDEEAANLVRYQQYYQANARVIETGSIVIDTLLGLRA